MNNGPTPITPVQASSKLRTGQYDYVIDVRTPSEWRMGHYQGAIHVPVEIIEDYDLSAFSKIPEIANILVYCMEGRRAERAANILSKVGYQNVEYLEGGYWDLTVV